MSGFWTITMDKTKMIESPPEGPGFSIEEADQADSMSIAHSAFNDPKEDYTLFTLYTKDREVIATRQVNG